MHQNRDRHINILNHIFNSDQQNITMLERKTLYNLVTPHKQY